MMKSILRLGGQWLFVLLLLASRSVGPAYAQLPSDATFLASLGELRDASYDAGQLALFEQGKRRGSQV